MNRFTKKKCHLKGISNPLYFSILQNVQRTVEGHSFHAILTCISMKNFLNHLKENYPVCRLKSSSQGKNFQQKQRFILQSDNEHNLQGE